MSPHDSDFSNRLRERVARALAKIDSRQASRAGWRMFCCEECGEQWKETTRDRFSPSGVDCPCCSMWVTPHASTDSPLVAVDKLHNVKKFRRVVIQKGVEPE